jgi:hypothetical protein
MQTARVVLAFTAIATLMTAPAMAKQVKQHHHHHHVWQNAYGGVPYYHGASQNAYGGVPYYPGAWHRGPDPYGVYFGNQKVSRDPDPNVRQELENDYSYLYSW